jgi:hypothetical protein
MATISQQVVEDIADLHEILAAHLAYDKSSCQKIDSMYKILVTGNGTPPLPELVRNHGEWIDERKAVDKENDRRSFEYKKGIIILAAGQILTLLVGIAAVYFKR